MLRCQPRSAKVFNRFLNWLAKRSPVVRQTNEFVASSMEKLGYSRSGGPIDASPAEKLVYALTGVSIDREHLRAALDAREAALEEIVASVDSITTPNGTLRKVRRLASAALAA
jgi:hypothetical protein